jgi:hypothetical protein
VNLTNYLIKERRIANYLAIHNMKKRIYLLLCLVFCMMFSLVGCGNKETVPELTEEIMKEI